MESQDNQEHTSTSEHGNIVDDEATQQQGPSICHHPIYKIYRVIWCKNGSATPYDSIDGCQESAKSIMLLH